MVEAVVDFDYVAQEADELTIRKGDILRHIQVRPGGWWEGTLNDKRGMFPDNFVHVIEKDADVVLRNKSREKRQCRAIFSYTPEHEDELKLNVGDTIEVLGEIEDGWWRGRLGEKEGVFPSNFVQEVVANTSLAAFKKSKLGSKDDLTNLTCLNEIDTHTPCLPPKPAKLCQALFAYQACNEDELTLKIGDVITLISKDGQDKGWWRGELRGRVGVFPDNFVTLLNLPAGYNTIEHSNASLEYSPLEDNKKTERPIAKVSPAAPIKSVIRKDSATKPVAGTVALQRKSLELNSKQEGPPVPGKKPVVPIKKSPSLTSTGIFSGLKQKVLGHEQKHSDTPDGTSSSRIMPPKETPPEEQKDDFDRVERSSMLVDPRANRAKAPGRRPPRMMSRDSESSLTNGNSEHPIAPPSPVTPVPDDTSETECKPKPRDWEIHRAPWMDELKLNQAKKTSPLNPSPESVINRLKFTSPSEHSRLKLSNEKLDSPDENLQDTTKTTRTSVFEKETTDMSKSMSAISSRLRTTTPDLPDTPKPGIALRNRNSVNQPVTATPIRPQSIHGETTILPQTNSNDYSRISPGMIRNQTPSPILKPPTGAASTTTESQQHSKGGTGDRKSEKSDPCTGGGTVSMKQYNELEEKVHQLETALDRQNQIFQAQFDDILRKLQSEIDRRQQLQNEVEKLAQCVTQV